MWKHVDLPWENTIQILFKADEFEIWCFPALKMIEEQISHVFCTTHFLESRLCSNLLKKLNNRVLNSTSPNAETEELA